MNVSDALPIQFWPIGGKTFNEQIIGFVDRRKFFQEFLSTDVIKLQVSNESNLDNYYSLRIVDTDEKLILTLPYIKTTLTGKNEFDLIFTPALLDPPIQDQSVRFYIVQNDGTLDAGTMDSETLDTEGDGDVIYKSDFIKFSSSIPENQSYGTKLISYKSIKNFAGINYPNDGAYFNFRVPARFYRSQNKTISTSLPLSDNILINTSDYRQRQRLMEMPLLPDYQHDKIEMILAHAVRGSVLIDGVEWINEESYERNVIDNRAPFEMAKTWLSRKNYATRNII